jgi:hypothetical protein
MTVALGDRLVRGALVLLAVAGCATTERGWTRPNTTEAEFNRDSYACAKETTSDTVRFKPFRGYHLAPEVDKDLYRACMRARGYQLVEGGAWRG